MTGEGTSGHQLASGAGGSVEHRVPGEHGFRFFPGFYKHVIDTMRRIPSFDGQQGGGSSRADDALAITQYGKPTFVVPAGFPRTPQRCRHRVARHPAAFGPIADLTPDESGVLRRALLADPHLVR